MKLVGYLMQRNESERGNLRRCLENLSRYCDDIVVYDDASTDDSLDVIRQFTDHYIESPESSFYHETSNRQQLLELAMSLGPDYIFWLDADEILDANGTAGGLRMLCGTGVSYSFPEITLWRSQTWRRLDYLGFGVFVRLWKNTGSLKIPCKPGLHNQLYPNGLAVKRSRHRVIHYGYSTREFIEQRWRERTKLGVPTTFRRKGIDESKMDLERVPQNLFPDGIPFPNDEPRPTPIRYSEDIMKEAGL